MRILAHGLMIAALAAAPVVSQVPIAQPPVLTEAPHFFHRPGGVVEARWIEKGELKSKRFAKGERVFLPQFKELLGSGFTVAKHATPKPVQEMPQKLMAISDVEGEYARMRRYLQNHKVVDENGGWAYGKGRLVCLGDFVDRGEQVTETLLYLHRLDREARAVGGQLHFVVGNHEVMMMGGDVRYTHPRYAQIAAKFGITIPGLLGADTEIGRWLRAQNCVLKLGDVVFVHAGLWAGRVDARFDFEAVNDAIRSGMGTPPEKLTPQLAGLMWARGGPLWYRGYFKKHALDFGPVPTVAQLDTIVGHLKARMIVVGHTKVAEVGYVAGGRRVLAIDTTWTSDEIVRGVIIEADAVRVLGLRNELTSKKLARRR